MIIHLEHAVEEGALGLVLADGRGFHSDLTPEAVEAMQLLFKHVGRLVSTPALPKEET